jgi:hypothetical protein
MWPALTVIARPTGSASSGVVSDESIADEPSRPGPVITAVKDSLVVAEPAAFFSATVIVAAAAREDVSSLVSPFANVTESSAVADVVSPWLMIEVAEAATVSSVGAVVTVIVMFWATAA